MPYNPPPVPVFGDASQISAWARFWLAGSKTAPKPTDEQLADYVDAAVRALTSSHPTLVLSGPNALAGADLVAFEEAAGAQVALLVAPTDIAAALVDRRLLIAREIRIGPVTHKIAASKAIVPPAERVGEYQAAVDKALAQISVLRVARPFTPLFQLAGRRRNQR